MEIDLSPQELLELMEHLTPAERAELDRLLTEGQPLWVPQVGPQTEALESPADIVFYGGSAGGGKALALDMPIPTPTGWTTMGVVQVGDELFDENGVPCRVVAVSPVMIGRPCHMLRFSDGAEIVADADHQWLTMDEAERELNMRRDPERRARRRVSRPRRGTGKRPDLAARNAAASKRDLPTVAGSVRTTREIHESLLSPRGALNHSVSVAMPLQTAGADLPIDPYLFGAWLGDGTSRSARITIAEQEMVGLVEESAAANGWGVTKGATKYDYGVVGGMMVALRSCGVLAMKHIPPQYLRAPIDQRIALLQGLMDTDGYADPRGQCEFTSTNLRLANDTAELIRSLGCKAQVSVGDATLNGRLIGPKYRIKFMARFPAFRLPRKAEVQRTSGFRPTVFRRYIESAEPTRSVPVRCVQVDSRSRLFLAGKDMVPTHNSELLLGAALTRQEHSIIFRREAVQLVGLEERMAQILGSRTGYNGQTRVWRLPAGKVLEFGSVKEPEDWMKYQGRPHDAKCVEVGTLVVMADGSRKPIEAIQVGDLVATLEGPREVERTFPRRLRQCVKVETAGASQVQSDRHELLAGARAAGRESIQSGGASRPSPEFAERCASLGSTDSNTSPDRTHTLEFSRLMPGLGNPLAAIASDFRSGQEIDCEAFACRPAGHAPLLEWFGLRARLLLGRLSPWLSAFLSWCARAVFGAATSSSLSGSTDCCSAGPNQYGARTLELADLSRQPAGARQDPLRSACAEAPTPRNSRRGAPGKTPSHSPESSAAYAHPYTKEIRSAGERLSFQPCVVTPVGERWTADIQVAEVNHYITDNGFINKNCFDEICHFLEVQFRTLIGWMRTDNPNVRQRVICAGNPPTDSDGEWVIRFWAPWLDPQHPNPAKSGELRWFVTGVDGKDMEVPGPEKVKVGDEWMVPKSRTFIRSSVDDNLFLQATGYKSTLQALPEPLRSQMLRGDFQAGRTDPVWQAIPTEWIKAAQARWQPRSDKGPMTALGLDPSRGGIDKTCAARRHGPWFDELVSVPATVTKDGPSAAGFVVPLVRNGACICVDSIGIGSSALDFLVGLNLNVLPVVASEASGSYTVRGNLRFKNRRAEMYWRLREALDPAAEVPISLPPDQELLGDLAAVRYKVVQMGSVAGIQMRDKDEIREVLGRSPDKGDAVAMTFVSGIPAPGAKRKSAPREAPNWRAM